ncbi:collagen-like protein [bacterium]|nr:collagen-like protein [bacterium]
MEGAQGLAGLQGFAGAQGLEGAQGLAGLQGFAGAQGLEGAQGLAGLQGFAGAQGLVGLHGFSRSSDSCSGVGVEDVESDWDSFGVHEANRIRIIGIRRKKFIRGILWVGITLESP